MTKAGGKRQKQVAARAGTAPPFEEAWNCPVKEGVYGSFCSDGTRVFVDQGARPSDWRVVALDAATGKQLWRYPWPSRVLMAHSGAVLVATWNWEVHVVDAVTGRPKASLWGALRSPFGDFHRGGGAGHSVAIGSRLVLFGAHREREQAMLRCFDLRSGERVWTCWLDSHSEGIALTDSRVLVSLFQRGIWAFEMATGRLCWKHDGHPLSKPKADGQRVFVSAVPPKGAWRTLALDLADGHVVWEAQRRVDWIDDGGLLGVDSDWDRLSSEPRIAVTDPATGRRVGTDRQITVPSSLRQFEPYGVLHVSDRFVFVNAGHLGRTENTGALLCLDRKTAECLWVHRPGGEVYSSVYSGDGRLIYRCGDRVYCLRQTT